MRVRLKKDVRDMARNRYAQGSLHDVVFALDGVPEVVGARYLPLSEDEWEPALAQGTSTGFSAGTGAKAPGRRARRGQETTERTCMTFRKTLVMVFGALLAFVLVACGGGGGQGGFGDGSVRVVATYSILGDMVENVGGEEVELTTLVGPNGDAHTFEPAPSDNAELAEADVVFENGLEFETWLDDLYESSGSEAERVVVTDDVDTLPIAEEEHGHEEEGAHEEEHADEEDAGEEKHGDEHGEFDPHVWHDPTNAVVMVESIRDALAEADPDNAEAYERNAEEYISELEELDADVQERVNAIPEDNRTLFTSHDTFGYFAERYGFGVDTALASVSTEAADPSAGETAELVEEIEASGVPAIFAENVSNSSVMENIAAEAGVELAPTLYTDALGDPGSEGGTYIEMVRYNATTMAEALK